MSSPVLSNYMTKCIEFLEFGHHCEEVTTQYMRYVNK